MQKTLSILSSSYLLKRLCFVAVVATCITVALKVNLPTDSDRKSVVYKTKLDQFKNSKPQLEAISIGNSHSIDFHFGSIGLNGMHFFNTGSDMEETLYKANAIIKDLPSLSYAFIALSPGSLHISQRYISSDYSKRRLQISRDLPFAFDFSSVPLDDHIASLVRQALPVSQWQDEFHKLFGYATAEVFFDEETRNRCIEYLPTAGDPGTLSTRLEDGIVGGYRHSLIKADCIEEFALRNSRHTIDRVNRTLAHEPDIARRNLDRLKQLADRLADVEATLIVVLPPVTRSYYESDELQLYVPEFRKLIEELQQHSSVTVYDFHDLYFDTTDDGRNEVFYDDNHLAYPGARAFSSILGSAMKKQAAKNTSTQLL